MSRVIWCRGERMPITPMYLPLTFQTAARVTDRCAFEAATDRWDWPSRLFLCYCNYFEPGYAPFILHSSRKQEGNQDDDKSYLITTANSNSKFKE